MATNKIGTHSNEVNNDSTYARPRLVKGTWWSWCLWRSWRRQQCLWHWRSFFSAGRRKAGREEPSGDDYELSQLCMMCLSLGHKGRMAYHGGKPCLNKSRYWEEVNDPDKEQRMAQRFQERMAEYSSKGGSSGKQENRGSSSTPTSSPASTPTSVSSSGQHPQSSGEFRYPQTMQALQPSGNPHAHHVPPWETRQNQFGKLILSSLPRACGLVFSICRDRSKRICRQPHTKVRMRCMVTLPSHRIPT